MKSLAPFSTSARRAIACVLLLSAHAVSADTPTAPRDPSWATLVDASANLYRVTPTLYRGARLTKNDVARLRSLGVKTVVSLRAFHTDVVILKDTGIKAVTVPINTWSIGDAEVIDALRAVRAAEAHGPVMLHCLHGADRTGMIVAMYRMVYQGRTREAALNELEQGGYGYHAIWKNIVHYVNTVDVDHLRQRIEQH